MLRASTEWTVEGEGGTMSKHINPRLALAVLAAVFAVVLAAPAQADTPGNTLPKGYVYDYFGPGTDQADTSGNALPKDYVYEYFGPGTGPADDPVRPDDRAFRGMGRAPLIVALRPDDRADRSLPNAGVVAGATIADRFDWGDAGIGAGAVFGLALLVAGASVVGLRHRRAAALS
jgi:hypothetical protein